MTIEDIKNYKMQLTDFINSDKFKNILLTNSNPSFQSYLDYFMDFVTTGKCMRGYLVKLGYDIATNFKETCTNEDILIASICYEIFETAILAHDDIIDNSPLRRNRDSMFIALGKNHLGLSRAICMGDYGIMLSSYLLQYTSFDVETKINALKTQSEVYLKTVIGELKDIDISNDRHFLKDDIFDMYYHKTALYSIIGPLTFGATLGKASEELIKNLYNIGKFLGYSYQIKDDYLGIFSDFYNTGKSTASDINEGKSTILASTFIEKASAPDKVLFLSSYGKGVNTTTDDILCVQNLFKKYDIQKTTETILEENIKTAYKLINEGNISDLSKKQLTDLASYLFARNK